LIALIPAGADFAEWFRARAEPLQEGSGVRVEAWPDEPDAELPQGLEPSDEELDWMVDYQAWRLETGVKFDPDLDLDTWYRIAWTNYLYYTSALAIARGERRLTHVVTSGSSRLMQRVIVASARRLGLPLWCLEQPIFPRHDAASLMLTRDRAIYEVPADKFNAWRDYDYQPDRMRAYRERWLADRRTKHERFVSDHTVSLPSGAVVWFQQVAGDAALYHWWVPPGAPERLADDAREHGAYAKGHPRGHSFPKADLPPERILPAEASIHDVFPQVAGVAVLSSAVGLEAWLYGLPVAVYGQPFYAHEGLANRSIPEMLAGPLAPEEDRLRLLDYFIHEYTLETSDAKGIVNRVLAAQTLEGVGPV
jgi:hypothetical protein